MQGVTCIIPALNEEKTIAEVIKKIKRVKEITEILVIDDGSTDETAQVARAVGAKVISHKVNFGKGAAMKTGVKNAKNTFVTFVDADIENISARKIQKLVLPLLQDEADFVKGAYQYASARVSKLVVKPMLQILYPWLKLEHPISGEIAINKNKITWGKIENTWGVDIQLVLQAAKKKLRIVEVSLGKKEHKHQSLENLSKMSNDIIRTILSELNVISHQHQLICFDLDKTLINQSSIELFAKEWGFTKELEQLQKKVYQNEIPDSDITKALAKHFQGRSREEIYKICEKITISPYAKEVIRKLRKQRYKVRIISAAYSPVVKYFASKLNIYDYICPKLMMGSNGLYNGKVAKSPFPSNEKLGPNALYIDKAKAVRSLCKQLGIKKENVLSIGDGKSDLGMFEASGLSLGYRTHAIGDHKIECMSEVLVYAE